MGSADAVLEEEVGTSASEEFGRFLTDYQLELQIDKGLKVVHSEVMAKLNQGAPGVLVAVNVYSFGDYKVAKVFVSGVGETPLIAKTNYIFSERVSAPPPGSLEVDESYNRMYTIENGQVSYHDLQKGWLVVGDAFQMLRLANEERARIQAAKEMARQAKEAQNKATYEDALSKLSQTAKDTAPSRQTLDQGPNGLNRAGNGPSVVQNQNQPGSPIDRTTGLPNGVGQGGGH